VLYSEKDQRLGTFFLAEVPFENAEKGILWFFKDHDPAQAYWLSGQTLRELAEQTKKLLQPESLKQTG
jgi:hypothetical protein